MSLVYLGSICQLHSCAKAASTGSRFTKRSSEVVQKSNENSVYDHGMSPYINQDINQKRFMHKFFDSAVRRVKIMCSSELERLLIKATKPDCEPPEEKYITRIVDTVSTFPAAMAAQGMPNNDYYRIFLHKIWARITEPDLYSVIKAHYIFHRVAQSLDVDAHNDFLQRYGHMQTSWSKASESYYFSSVDWQHGCFLDAYAAFVFDRFVAFSGRFEDHFPVDSEDDISQLWNLLKKACRVLDRALRVADIHEDEICEVTMESRELVINDCFCAKQCLWEVFGKNLALLIDGQRRGKREAVIEFNDNMDNLDATRSLLLWTLKTIKSLNRLSGAPRVCRIGIKEEDLIKHVSWIENKKEGAKGPSASSESAPPG